MSLADLCAVLGGRPVLGDVFGLIRNGRRFAIAPFTFAGRAFLSIETSLGERGAVDEWMLTARTALPLGGAELRDGGYHLRQALPADACAEDVEAVLAYLALTADALAPIRPRGVCSALACWAQ